MGMRPQIGPEGQGRPLIVTLDRVDAGALAQVGGKAANLGELRRINGIEVPPGLCVTTGAFERVVSSAPVIADCLWWLTTWWWPVAA